MVQMFQYSYYSICFYEKRAIESVYNKYSLDLGTFQYYYNFIIHYKTNFFKHISIFLLNYNIFLLHFMCLIVKIIYIIT